MTHKEALEMYISATNSHDFDHVEKLVHQDAVYWFREKVQRGHAQIRSYFEGTWSSIKDEVYKIDGVEWLTEDADSAVCLYNYYWSGYFDGKLIEGSGRATNVFVREDGEWKLIHEHLTPNL